MGSYEVFDIRETAMPLPNVEPDLRTRFRSRADRRAARLNAAIVLPTYRWEVVRQDERWAVVAFQNVARSLDG